MSTGLQLQSTSLAPKTTNFMNTKTGKSLLAPPAPSGAQMPCCELSTQQLPQIVDSMGSAPNAKP